MKISPVFQTSISALLVLSLALPAWAASAKFHQFEGENLIQADQIPPTEKVGEYELDGKKLTLEITTDKDRIGVMPGSRVKFTVRLLVDGAPLQSTAQLAELFSEKESFVRYNKDHATLRINTRKLDQNLQINLLDNTKAEQGMWLDDGQTKNRLVNRDMLGRNSCEQIAQPYWSPLIVADKPQAEVTNQLISDKLISADKDEGFASFDFSDASLTFEFIYGGVRVLPFVEIAVGLVGIGGMTSQKVVFFEDQFTGRASRIKPSAVSKGYPAEYRVEFSKSALSPGVPTPLTLKISSHDPESGEPITLPWQRVRVTAVPLYKIPNIASLGSFSTEREFKNPYLDDDRSYNPMAFESPIKQAGLTIQIPGTFALTEADKARYSTNLSMGEYSAGGGYVGGSLTQTCTSPSTIEADLIDGHAEIPFAYNGNQGPSGQLVFVVQPSNYFMPYGVKDLRLGWKEGDPVDFSEYFKNRLGTKEYDARKEELTTYREANNILYPIDKLTEDDTKREWASIGYPFTTSPTLYLYGDTWLQYPDHKPYRSETYTIATINIGSPLTAEGGGIGFWMWVLIGHIIKIAVLALETVYLRKKSKTVKS